MWSSSPGTLANEGFDGEHWSIGLSGRMLLKPQLVLMRQLDVEPGPLGAGRTRCRSYSHSFLPAQPAFTVQPICCYQAQSIFSHWEKDRHAQHLDRYSASGWTGSFFFCKPNYVHINNSSPAHTLSPLGLLMFQKLISRSLSSVY